MNVKLHEELLQIIVNHEKESRECHNAAEQESKLY